MTERLTPRLELDHLDDGPPKPGSVLYCAAEGCGDRIAEYLRDLDEIAFDSRSTVKPAGRGRLTYCRRCGRGHVVAHAEIRERWDEIAECRRAYERANVPRRRAGSH